MKQENSLFNGLTHSHTVFLVLGLWSLVEGEKWLLYSAEGRAVIDSVQLTREDSHG